MERHQEYLPFLYETARSYPDVRVLELGTRTGNSTWRSSPPPRPRTGMSGPGTSRTWPASRRDAASARVPRWTFVHGDDMDPAVQAQFPAEVDVFFLDTSHEYEHTLAELRAYMPRVAKRRGRAVSRHEPHRLGREPPEGRLARGAAGAGRLVRGDGTVLGEQAGRVRPGRREGSGVETPAPRGSWSWRIRRPPSTPGSLELLESGELDWDNPRHREAYLRAWVNGTAPPPPKQEEPDPPAG